jgi:DNA-binding XRE family transcriptional regulator
MLLIYDGSTREVFARAWKISDICFMNIAMKKQLAKGLFLNSKLSQKEIALQVGVTEKTIGKWCNDPKENWEKLKQLGTITRTELLNQALRQLKTRNDQIDGLDLADYKNLKILTDSKAVLIKEIELLSDQPLHVYIGVVNELIEWSSKVLPSQLKNITDVCYEFIEDINKRQK